MWDAIVAVARAQAASVRLVNAAAITLLVVAGLTALVNAWAVNVGRRSVEQITKPLTMVFLIAVAIVIDAAEPAIRIWFIVALLLSLAGDVFLLPQVDNFIGGLASFLLGHVAYIAGLAISDLSLSAGLIGIGIALVASAIIGWRIQQAAAHKDRRLGIPVAGYSTVISVMFATAVATTDFMAIRGAILFYSSDAILGWNRFVKPMKGGRLATMLTYHSAQAFLVVALTTL